MIHFLLPKLFCSGELVAVNSAPGNAAAPWRTSQILQHRTVWQGPLEITMVIQGRLTRAMPSQVFSISTDGRIHSLSATGSSVWAAAKVPPTSQSPGTLYKGRHTQEDLHCHFPHTACSLSTHLISLNITLLVAQSVVLQASLTFENDRARSLRTDSNFLISTCTSTWDLQHPDTEPEQALTFPTLTKWVYDQDNPNQGSIKLCL